MKTAIFLMGIALAAFTVTFSPRAAVWLWKKLEVPPMIPTGWAPRYRRWQNGTEVIVLTEKEGGFTR